MTLSNNLDQINKASLEAINQAKTLEELRDVEVQFLGRKGEVTALLRGMKDLSVEEKREQGPKIQKIKKALEQQINKKRDDLESAFDEQVEWIDVTAPARLAKTGHLHPLTLVQEELEDIFVSMGFMVLDGPELESEYYNFEAINIPGDHPAREMQDTFYIKDLDYEPERGGKSLLRTHTSSVQVRAMQKYGAPLRAVVPGRVFRFEATDASHDTNFNQIEGMMIGKDISIANLKAVLLESLRRVFHEDITIRVRPGFFPFVEPGLEVDFSCLLCKGKGCSVCKHTGWVEFLGAGMIHPNVLKAGGLNPKKVNGFAFGMGTTRLVMMKYGIKDIRLLLNGDLRLVNQF